MTSQRPPRLGPLLVLGTIVVVAVYGSLALSSRREPVDAVPPSISLVVTASPSRTAAATESHEIPSPTPTLRPFPVERAYPSAPAVEPAPDDDLALAGRGGVPGLIDCGFGLPFSIQAIKNPPGAEDLPGPEYDALRTLLAQYVVLGEFKPDPTAREVARGPSTVMFLVDHQYPSPAGGFPFVPVSVDFADGYWLGYEGVDCNPMAVLPPGYAAATWRMDPAHSKPTSKTRALHLLVREHGCASGKSAAGRIGPAYVIATAYEVNIGVMIEERPGGDDCQGSPETSARLSLNEPLGERSLRDMYDYLLIKSGG